ncbi:hypothetical protein AB0937_34155 [Streptomyces sp. NPDC047880]|uniref:hypothetical protein n=1 Tax=Streptomyces sp. NPDC047880 TaxID=3155626 RepID=UPI003454DE26
MTTHRIVTGHVSALLALPDGLDSAAARAADRSLPGGWRLEAAPDAAGTADIEVTIGAAAVTAGRHTVRVRLPRAAASSDTLAYVTYTALERARQRRRKVTMHGTALHPPGGPAVLLLGAKGAGKTSTALALAARGWLHGGDDLVVLEGAEAGAAVWPGKPTAAVRAPARPLDPKPQHSLRPFVTGPAPLGRIVRVAVHPELTAASLTPARPLSVNERLRLHENLARYISGLPTPLNGVSGMPYGPVWPLDTPALARWRSHLIATLAASRFDYLHAPDAETAADLLAKETETG